MPPAARTIAALAAFPAGWAVREALGGAAGGVVVLSLIALAAAGLPARRALAVGAAGVLCFAALHLLAGVTGVYSALALGAAAFAAITSAAWRSFSSARRATRAT